MPRKKPVRKTPMRKTIEETARLNGVGPRDDKYEYEKLATFNNAISAGFRGRELYQLGEYLGLGKAPAPPAPAGGVPAVLSPKVRDEREDDEDDNGDDPEYADFGGGISGESGPNASHDPESEPHDRPWHEDRA